MDELIRKQMSETVSKMENVGDAISRQAAQHKINALIDEFETIMKEIRERNVDDSVCGLCEYDGAFMSDSGNWCNECPGFERDDCFKLKDQYREEWAGAIKNLPTVQPKHGKWIERNPLSSDKCRLIECDQCGNSYIVGFNVPYEHWIDNRNYCEKCGADMRGEQESE